MCGIAGYVGREPPDAARLEACLRRMAHRGPDHAAHRTWRTADGRTVVFAHTRLSIIDLDPRSHQPMGRDGLWLALNGEVYNYREVRRDLEARGEAFATTSDTEVLLAALRRDGAPALDRCEGMWAFAAFDERTGEVLLCRDRFGEKPLFLLEEAHGTWFASEPKALAALRGRPLRPDLVQLRRYLALGYRALHKGERTFFEDLRPLPAATWLRLGPRGRQVHRYWTLRHAPREDMTYQEAVAGVRQRLLRAVELRLRADVPLAFCMSGGVDSNSLISVAKRVHGHDVHGFTVLDDDPRYDERALVQQAVGELGLRHTGVPVDTADFLAHLRALVRQHDGPVATISYYAHWRLMRAVAAHGYRIAISGTGADELFTGYYDHHLQYLAMVRGDPARHAEARAEWERGVAPAVRNAHLRDPDRFVRDPGFREHLYPEAARFSAALVAPLDEAFAEQRFTGDLLRNRMLNELHHEIVPVILHEDDLNAMAFSIENRSPFLDRELAEFAFTIPTRHLVRDGRAKAVLRDAVAGILPEALRTNRRKVGFNAALDSFLDRGDPAVRAEVLAKGPVFDLVRREAVAALMDAPRLTEAEAQFLWRVLGVKMFLEECA